MTLKTMDDYATDVHNEIACLLEAALTNDLEKSNKVYEACESTIKETWNDALELAISMLSIKDYGLTDEQIERICISLKAKKEIHFL